MKKLLTKGLVIISAAVLPMLVQADIDTGMYFQLLGGASFMPGMSASFQNGTEVVQENTTFKTGYNGMFAVGYQFPMGWRSDLSIGYIDNRVASNYSNTINNNMQGGSAEAYTFFGNLYYDFAPCSVLQPYVGAGLGYVTTRYHWDIETGGTTTNYSTSPGFFGYEAVAGVTYQVTPHFGLLLDYRYVGTTTSQQTISSEHTSGKYNMSFSSNLASIGISYLF